MRLQAAERAIQDIDVRVKDIVGTANTMYSRSELSPYLDQLETASADTVTLMRQLDQALQCQPIFRYNNGPYMNTERPAIATVWFVFQVLQHCPGVTV